MSIDSPPRPSPVDSPPPRSRGNRLVTLSVLGLLAIVLGGGGVAVMSSPLANSVWAFLGRSSLQAIKLVPAEAPVVLHLAPTLGQLKNLETIKTRFETVPEFKKAFEQFERSIGSEENLNVKDDILSWLGPEIVLALHDGEGLKQSNKQNKTLTPSLALVMATRDRAKSDAFIEKIKAGTAKNKQPLTQQHYGGQTILTNSKDVWLTNLKDFVVFASTEKSLQRTIDLAEGKGGRTLLDLPAYQEIVRALPAERFGDLYIDWSVMVDQVDGLGSIGLDPKQREMIRALRAMGVALRFEENGIMIEAATLYDPARLAPEQQVILKQNGTTFRAIETLPAKTSSLIALQDLRSYWNMVTAPYRLDQSFVKGLESFNKSTGLDLEADLLSWMTGEIALAVIEDRPGYPMGGQSIPVGSLFMIETTERAVVETKLKRIREVIEKQGLRAVTKTVNGVEFIQFVVPRTGSTNRQLPEQPAGGYGFVGNYLVIATTPEGFAQVVDAKTASLKGMPHYQAVDQLLTKDRQVLMYVDLAATLALVDALGQGGNDTEIARGLAMMRPIKAIALSSEAMNQAGISRSRMVVLIP